MQWKGDLWPNYLPRIVAWANVCGWHHVLVKEETFDEEGTASLVVGSHTPPIVH